MLTPDQLESVRQFAVLSLAADPLPGPMQGACPRYGRICCRLPGLKRASGKRSNAVSRAAVWMIMPVRPLRSIRPEKGTGGGADQDEAGHHAPQQPGSIFRKSFVSMRKQQVPLPVKKNTKSQVPGTA